MSPLVGTFALGAGVSAQVVGVGSALAAAAGGSSDGGIIAFMGFGLTLVVALLAAATGLVGGLGLQDVVAKRRAWWGLGLGLGAPVLAGLIIVALVPASAFRI